MAYRPLVHACHHIPRQRRLTPVSSYQPDGTRRALESQRMLTKPYMVLFQSVARDRYRPQTCLAQLAELSLRQRQSVRHHAPWITALFQRTPYLRQVLAHQRLAARYHDHHAAGVHVRRHLRVYHTQEIGGRHVRRLDGRQAVAAAMQAMHIAAKRRLPE